ncbi:PIN domain-containing protein [Geminicoccus harenae]|uniref:PIN domain-containing protein n=1 Tax=Geminicoccus harenae TaxID=2498453 RepID=UPI00168AC1E5|nr:PIN domain-containing protein [Geminicoccus harenae]
MIGVDTNVLVYAARRSDDPRHFRAAAIVEILLTEQRLFLPLQTLAELHHVLRRKAGMAPQELASRIGTYLELATVEPYRPDDLTRAMEAVARHRLSLWDALIWAVCDRMEVAVLLSEDLQDGRMLGGVMFVNPFGGRMARFLTI